MGTATAIPKHSKLQPDRPLSSLSTHLRGQRRQLAAAVGAPGRESVGRGRRGRGRGRRRGGRRHHRRAMPRPTHMPVSRHMPMRRHGRAPLGRRRGLGLLLGGHHDADEEEEKEEDGPRRPPLSLLLSLLLPPPLLLRLLPRCLPLRLRLLLLSGCVHAPCGSPCSSSSRCCCCCRCCRCWYQIRCPTIVRCRSQSHGAFPLLLLGGRSTGRCPCPRVAAAAAPLLCCCGCALCW